MPRRWPWSASSEYLRKNRNPLPAISRPSSPLSQRSALYIALMLELIAVVPCRTNSSIGSAGNVLSSKVASKNFMSTVLNSPLCHDPLGKSLVFGQLMVSLVNLVMWARCRYLKQKFLYRSDKAENLSSMFDPSSIMDKSAKAPPRKARATPRCHVWKKSKVHRAGSWPGTCGTAWKGDTPEKGSSWNSVFNQSGRLVATCSNQIPTCPAWHWWQMPTNACWFFLFCTLLKDRVNDPDLWSQGQSPVICKSIIQRFPSQESTPVVAILWASLAKQDIMELNTSEFSPVYSLFFKPAIM